MLVFNLLVMKAISCLAKKSPANFCFKNFQSAAVKFANS